MNFADRLATAVRAKRSITCVGLDPRPSQLPSIIRDAIGSNSPDEWAAAYTQFCCEIIDVVADKVPCVKPQSAFFEQIGPAGVISLAHVIAHARAAGLLVIVDAKRNDIGSTATAYAEAYLGADSPFGGDSLTVSPYLGRDSIEPFVEACDKKDSGIFVLVKTSNPGGGLFQDRTTDGQPLYAAVASLVNEFNESRVGLSGYGPIGAVVGATYPEQLTQMRSAMPHSWILIPGFGAQGGSADDIRPGLNPDGLGAIVNSSRQIIFAYERDEYREKYSGPHWHRAIEAATDEMNQQLA
jgi:orotidine-5'-phosphate decarboxylase